MKLHIPSIPMSHLMITAFAVAVSVSTLSAATSTWNGGGGDWETNSNWAGGVPGDNDTAFLPGNSPNTITITGTTAAIASLQTENTSAAWVLTNGVLAFRTNASGSITTPTNGNTGSLTIYSQITANNLNITGARIDIHNTNNDITGTITLLAGSRVIFRAPEAAGSATFNLRNSTQLQLGAGVFTNDIILQGGNNMGVYGFGLAGKTLEVAGNISEVSGPRDMVFSALNDNATIVISGSNSYSGNTTIGRTTATSDTTIRITHDNAFGSSNAVANVTFLSTTNTGAQTLEMSGGITVVNRNLTLFGAGIGSKGSLFNASGNNTWDGGIDLGITNNPTIGVTNGTTLTVKGEITGNAVDGLTKAGEGTLIFEGDNSYSTGTKINAGTLELKASSGSALGGTASVTVSSGATLLLSKSDQVNNSAAITLSGGTIERASGVSETFGNLNLTAASTLDYGSGATGALTFGTYTPSSLLTVNNFLAGNTLLFSSDLTSTVTNGTYFSFDNSFNYNWDSGTSTFTITAIPEPATCAVAAGLIGLMLHPFLRRRLRDETSG